MANKVGIIIDNLFFTFFLHFDMARTYILQNQCQR